jgi:precorrin-3B methylase
MECENRALLEEWMERWMDLVDFEVIPVVTSSAAAAAVVSSGPEE